MEWPAIDGDSPVNENWHSRAKINLGRSEVGWVIKKPGQLGGLPNLKKPERVQSQVLRGSEETGRERQSLNGGSVTGSRWGGVKSRFEPPAQTLKD
jgi:hypothetical protein